MAFDKITVFEAPSRVRKAVERYKTEEKAAVYVVEGTVYLVITMGQKSTGGYGIRVKEIEQHGTLEGGSGFNIHVEYKKPKPGQPVCQAITYPYAIVKTNIKDISKDTVFNFLTDSSRKTVQPEGLAE